MAKMLRSTRMVLVIAVTLLASFHAAPEARAVVIGSGFDWFSTEQAHVVLLGESRDLVSFSASTKCDATEPCNIANVPVTVFTSLRSATIPGLLPPKVDIEWLDQHGNTVGPDSAHGVRPIIQPVLPFPPPDLFDTIVQRLTSVDVSGIGGWADADIKMIWLSLKSTKAVDVPSIGLFDFYVHLDPNAEQDIGRMRFISKTQDGVKGELSLGKPDDRDDYHCVGEDPCEPLGLPLKYIIDFIPEGLDPLPGNIAFSCPGSPSPPCPDTRSVFHDIPPGPQGVYDVPAPATLILVGAGIAALVRIRRRTGVERRR